MRIKTTLLATTALAALALAVPAHAAGGWYVNVTGGGNWLDDNDFVATTAGGDALTVSTGSDGGFVVAGAVGFNLGTVVPGLRVEAEVAYRENQVDGVFTATPVAGSTTGTLDYDHSALSVLANVWYDFDLGDVSPYIGGGIGWADVEADGNFADASPAVYPFSVSDDGFAWQLGAGINFKIAPNMKLGVGYRYFSGPEVTLSGTALVATNLAADELDYDNHSAVATISFGM